jgi:hypothetical protein
MVYFFVVDCESIPFVPYPCSLQLCHPEHRRRISLSRAYVGWTQILRLRRASLRMTIFGWRGDGLDARAQPMWQAHSATAHPSECPAASLFPTSCAIDPKNVMIED